MSFNSKLAEATTFNIIKQTVDFLNKNNALKISTEEVMELLSQELPQMPKVQRRPKLTAEARSAKKVAAAEKKAAAELRKAERIAKKQAVADLKAEKAAAKLAKKEAVLAEKAEKAEARAAKKAAAAEKKAAAALRKAEREAKKDAAADTKAAKAEEKQRARLLKQLAKFASPEEDLMVEMKGKSISKLEGLLAHNLKAAAEEKEHKKALKALKAQNPRPKGRAPKGKMWCYENGEWIDTISTADTVFLA